MDAKVSNSDAFKLDVLYIRAFPQESSEVSMSLLQSIDLNMILTLSHTSTEQLPALEMMFADNSWDT